MLGLISLFIVILLSLLVTRVASAVLVQTGLSQQVARFQARSALTGCGFTTDESNSVVNHPVRRRVISLLMLMGSAGIVTVVGTLMLTFAGTGNQELRSMKFLIILGGLLFLFLLSRSQRVDHYLSRVIHGALRRWTKLRLRNVDSLLHLAERFGIAEILVEPEDWVAGKTLGEADLRAAGVAVLGVERREGEGFVAAPDKDTKVCPGDVLIVYGHEGAIEGLGQRPKGP
ncbi:MAG TPA: TrkA C-terminal domain-containing protein, partial [Candidatus Nanopelagicales bacterium]|nr:TrkA C-terminal domain-containing protein [Candidatus Nanopelagicales bacterium]